LILIVRKKGKVEEFDLKVMIYDNPCENTVHAKFIHAEKIRFTVEHDKSSNYSVKNSTARNIVAARASRER